MIRLEQALSDLKQQVLKALMGAPHQRSGIDLEAERVILTLELESRQTEGPAGKQITSFYVCESRLSSPASHSNGNSQHAQAIQGKHILTIEFKPARLGSNQPTSIGEPRRLITEASRQAEPAPAIPGDSTLLTELSTVLGPPGFDSSARAAILREMLQTLPMDRTNDLIAALREPPGTPIAENINQACHLIRGILLSGPAKSVSKGAEIFEQIFARHTIQDMLTCLETAWKTQDDWM